MLFSNPRKLLSEAATADLLNPEVSDEVKEVIDELEDDLTNNIEEVDEKDKTTNGGIPKTAEGVAMMESVTTYGRARYLVTLEDVMDVQASEGEKAATEAKAEEEPGVAPTPEECEKAEPDPVNVIDDIAEKNGVDPEQVAVVITAESVRFLAETALLEAKTGRDCGAARKLVKTSDTINKLKGKISLVKA